MVKKFLLLFFLLVITSCTYKQRSQLNNFYGIQKLNNKKYQEAIPLFLTINKNEKSINQYKLYNCSIAYIQLNEIEAAIEYLNQLTNIDNKKINALAHFQLGNIYFRKNDFTTAILYLKKSIQIDNTLMEAKYNYELSKYLLDNLNEEDKEPEATTTKTMNEKMILDFIKEKEVQIWELKQEKVEEKIKYDY